MSGIGPGTLGAINLAGSVAGAQRNSADADRVKEGAAEKKLQSDLKALAASSMDDVGEADESSDRDADGRMPLGYHDRQTDGEDSASDSNPRMQSHRAKDADGNRGVHLDLEA